MPQVTDAREPAVRPPLKTALTGRPSASQRHGTRLISVDHVLQYASDIPSAQPRGGDQNRPRVHTRTPSGKHPLEPKLRGVGVPLTGVGPQHMPARTSKTSEKLVLLPETTEEEDGQEKEAGFGEEDEDETRPPSDEALRARRQGGGKSDAERLPKSQRTAEAQLARVTAYCTAQAYRLKGAAQFVRERHGAKTKLYDDCLYCVYQLPLLGGSEGFRIRSSPVVRNPGGRSVLEEQIEANERRVHQAGWHEESAEYAVPLNEGNAYATPPEDESEARERGQPHSLSLPNHPDTGHARRWSDGNRKDHQDHGRRESDDSLIYPSPQPAISPDAYTVAELFIFSYGVAVFWNFTPNQEKDVLADLTFSSNSAFHNQQALQTNKYSHPMPKNTEFGAAGLPLMSRPLDEDDFETEEFHFQYDAAATKPRIYNDMITLRTSDHMVKLAMAHAIAQSTKLSYFEERMQRTMTEAQYVPRRLALEGRLGMSRREVVRLVGRLFEGRVDVNLCKSKPISFSANPHVDALCLPASNMLDTPNFFWDSEPTLHPLYQAVREYLEIKPRIQVLNERCRVFLDLAEILSDSIADVKMTRITWIIIILIVLSILVTCTEVFLRFGILAAGRQSREGDSAMASPKEL